MGYAGWLFDKTLHSFADSRMQSESASVAKRGYLRL